ncbi:MAG: hypothetical protein M1830_009895 [Pleopsidium flavum]|nr:MAG: hypothetical protein M1830_009895 [Pleopsidium flavum]
MTARRVTPIYPADANLIVSLLDIHASIPNHISPHQSRIEILEAGTGHGALTLHLARAIHSTNPPLPVAAAAAPEQPSRGEETSAATTNSENNSGVLESPPTQLHGDPDLKRWRASRRAIIHGLDISAENSTHASQIVSGFRRGLYAGNVDFHVGDVSEWISKELEDRTKGSDGQQSEAFLSHILLDLPAAQLHLERISSTLRVDGVLTVFNPSITQITACVEVIREKRLPLVLDRVVELGPGMTGGREWDVRAVRPRAVIKAQSDRAKTFHNAGEEGRLPADVSGEKSRDEEQVQALATHGQRWELVCRPKVGGRVFGGGFLGVWRRMRHRREGN